MILVTNDDVMGANIRYLRKKKNLSLEAFAFRMGISPEKLNAIETGETREIEDWVMRQICDFFSTNLQNLVEKM